MRVHGYARISEENTLRAKICTGMSTFAYHKETFSRSRSEGEGRKNTENVQRHKFINLTHTYLRHKIYLKVKGTKKISVDMHLSVKHTRTFSTNLFEGKGGKNAGT